MLNITRNWLCNSSHGWKWMRLLGAARWCNTAHSKLNNNNCWLQLHWKECVVIMILTFVYPRLFSFGLPQRYFVCKQPSHHQKTPTKWQKVHINNISQNSLPCLSKHDKKSEYELQEITFSICEYLVPHNELKLQLKTYIASLKQSVSCQKILLLYSLYI